MEHNSEQPPEQPEEPQQYESTRWLKVLAKVVGGGVVLFIVAVALVFGVCLFG